MAIGLKKIMAAACKPVNHFRATHSLWPAPGIQVAIALKGEAMLLDAHVAHAHFVDELIDGESASPFERIQIFKTLCAADFGE